jgi:hypothetical protein
MGMDSVSGQENSAVCVVLGPDTLTNLWMSVFSQDWSEEGIPGTWSTNSMSYTTGQKDERSSEQPP